MNPKSLTPMQKAYLLGKSKMFPLSQSSMHDFREFKGQMDAKTLAQRMSQLIELYPALRTVIDETQLVQRVESNIDVMQHLKIYDFSHFNLTQATIKLEMLREEYRHFSHDLSTSPWQIALIQLPESAETSSVVLTSFDGLIIDGYSISVLLDQLFNLNNDLSLLSNNADQDSGQSDCSFFEASEKDRQFWHEKLAQIEEVTQLPWVNSLDSISKLIYSRRTVVIEKAQFDALSKLAAQYKVFPNALLTTLILEVISRWTEEQKLLISMPVSNSALHKKVGNSSSFIVLDYQYHYEISFVDQIKATQKQILESMAHTSYSGIELSKFLIKNLQESIVLPVALTNGLSWVKPSKSSLLRYVGGQTQTPQLALDIRLSFSESSDLVIDLDFIEQALSPTMIQNIADTLLKRINDLSCIKTELEQPKRVSNVVTLDDDADVTDDYEHIEVVDYLANIQRHLFEEIPDKTALIYEGQSISYAELGANVAKVRRALDLVQIGQNQVVAICLRKSPEHIYSILACALSGIIWLPVDMDSPQFRQQYIISNSRADLAISTAPIEGLLTLNIDQILKSSTHGSLYSGSAESVFESEIIWQHRHDASPAYYLYTSGSTGTPKCVVLNNRATAHVLQETIEFWCINQNDIHLAATPFHHDMSIFDLMAPLSVGGTLVIPTLEEAKSAVAWAQLIERYQVSIWCTVPAMADMLLTSADPKQLQSIRLINQGGDYVKPSVIKKLRGILPNARLISIGGPTETTIWSIWHEITPEDINVIPYGKEMKHNRYYILNPWGEFCPPGVVGQLYMSGINLANGYLLDGKITQKDFVLLTLPNGEVHRVFRMSDKGYLREDGNIIFAGRDEGYLKVRGVRIAASEVENAILKHPRISDCVVTVCSNPIYEGNELVAIYTIQDTHQHDAGLNAIRPSELRQFLQDYVPNSHIPSRWLPLAQFPITRNGKIDRKTLKQTAQDFLYQSYAQASSKQTVMPSDSSLNQQQGDTEKSSHHAIGVSLADGQTSIAQDVIKHLQSSLNTSNDLSDVLLDTEILALGLTSGYLSRLVKHFSQEFNTSIQFSDLAKCKTIGEIVHNIESQLYQK